LGLEEKLHNLTTVENLKLGAGTAAPEAAALIGVHCAAALRLTDELDESLKPTGRAAAGKIERERRHRRAPVG
jgi:hypothetical protein